MGEVITSAAQEIWDLLRASLSAPLLPILAGIVLAVAVVASAVRGRLASAWLWIPALAVAGFWAARRWIW